MFLSCKHGKFGGNGPWRFWRNEHGLFCSNKFRTFLVISMGYF